MKKIAITSTIEERKNAVNTSYINAFNSNLTIPFIVPSFTDELTEFINEEKELEYQKKAEEIERISDCLILTGGGDINPVNFNKNNLSSFYCNSRRDLSEIYLIERFMQVQKPIMGICRGFQLLGIKLGLPGFQQEIPQEEELHTGNNRELSSRKEYSHTIKVFGSLADYLLKARHIKTKNEEIPVNSFHHQGFILADKDEENPELASKKIAEINQKSELNILGSTETVIEAFEHKTLPIFAVQWHPEEYGNESIIINYFLNKYVLGTKKDD